MDEIGGIPIEHLDEVLETALADVNSMLAHAVAMGMNAERAGIDPNDLGGEAALEDVIRAFCAEHNDLLRDAVHGLAFVRSRKLLLAAGEEPAAAEHVSPV